MPSPQSTCQVQPFHFDIEEFMNTFNPNFNLNSVETKPMEKKNQNRAIAVKAGAIIHLWLKKGFTGVGGIYWLFLLQLSKNSLDPLFEKVFQEAMDNIALYPPHRQKFINNISSGGSAASSLRWQWQLLGDYSDEWIAEKISSLSLRVKKLATLTTTVDEPLLPFLLKQERKTAFQLVF